MPPEIEQVEGIRGTKTQWYNSKTGIGPNKKQEKRPGNQGSTLKGRIILTGFLDFLLI